MGPQVDLQSQDPVLEGRRRVTEHGEVLEVQTGRLHESLALGTLDGWETASFHGLGSLPESQDHVVGVKGRHESMLGVLSGT